VSQQADSGSGPAAAVVRDVRAWSAASALAAAIGQAGLDQAVAAPRHTTGPAVILTGLSPPAPVHREVVESLVDLLFERGWRQVVVTGAVRVRDRDRGLTDLGHLSTQAGLRGQTQAGNPYRVTDLYEDLVQAPVAESSVLFGQLVGAEWVGAGLRVVVARNVTDLADGYRLCLDELVSVACPIAGASPGDVAVDVLTHLQPQLAVVDALVSSHGFAGSVIPRWLDTATLIVGNDALLADVVGARLQAVDPGVSRLVHAALAGRGLSPNPRIVGELTPFVGWESASPLTADALQRAGASVERLAAAVLSPVGAGGTGTDAIMSGLQQTAAAYTDNLDSLGMRQWAEWMIAGAGYAAAVAREQARAWLTLFAADRIDRVTVPLGFDPGAYSDSDFAAVVAEAAGFERLLAGTPSTEGGLRWITHDRAVVFEVSRVLRAPFAEFVARVDVSQGISLMADYIGGRVVVLERDGSGRPVLQAERNLYLAQPNYLAFWGGLPIDVCKIEAVSYSDTEHRLVWRTVRSPNGSATYDDGAMTVADAGSGLTRVRVSGRQLFTLPPFWQAVDLDRFPAYKAVLVEDAYRRFFDATFDNVEACYEGREFRIGRPPVDPAGPLPTEVLASVLSAARQRLTDTSAFSQPKDEQTDANGFRHFSGVGASPAADRTTAWREAATAYLSAAAADWARLMTP
jgi:hypothetical protein